MAATSIIDAMRLPNEIKEALLHDLFAKTVRENPEEHSNFEDRCYGVAVTQACRRR
jgi:hypothetical protein